MYLSLGMKLVKVHRIVKFKQSDWLKKCIGFRTGKRRKRINVRLVNNGEDYKKIGKQKFCFYSWN